MTAELCGGPRDGDLMALHSEMYELRWLLPPKAVWVTGDEELTLPSECNVLLYRREREDKPKAYTSDGHPIYRFHYVG